MDSAGSVDAALRYLRAHPPRGFVVTGSGSSRGSGPEVDSLLLDGRSTRAYRQLGLLLDVTRDRDGVAVRAEAQALWLPRRTAAEHLGGRVTSVDVTLARQGDAPALRGDRTTLVFHGDGPDAAVRDALGLPRGVRRPAPPARRAAS